VAPDVGPALVFNDRRRLDLLLLAS